MFYYAYIDKGNLLAVAMQPDLQIEGSNVSGIRFDGAVDSEKLKTHRVSIKDGKLFYSVKKKTNVN